MMRVDVVARHHIYQRHHHRSAGPFLNILITSKVETLAVPNLSFEQQQAQKI